MFIAQKDDLYIKLPHLFLTVGWQLFMDPNKIYQVLANFIIKCRKS